MITIYDHFPESPPEYELFMVVPPPRDEVLVNWPFSDSTNWLSSRSGGSQFIQGATPFSIAEGCSISSVVIPMRSMKAEYPGSSAVRIDLREGSPSGPLLGSGQVADFNSAGQYIEKEFVLSSPVSLQPGVTYWVTFVLPSVTGGDCVYQMPVRTGPGAMYRLSPSGSWVQGVGQVCMKLVKA